jgi:hypothetical protein
MRHITPRSCHHTCIKKKDPEDEVIFRCALILEGKDLRPNVWLNFDTVSDPNSERRAEFRGYPLSAPDRVGAAAIMNPLHIFARPGWEAPENVFIDPSLSRRMSAASIGRHGVGRRSAMSAVIIRRPPVTRICPEAICVSHLPTCRHLPLPTVTWRQRSSSQLCHTSAARSNGITRSPNSPWLRCIASGDFPRPKLARK